MSNLISDAELDALFNGVTPFALIDVRESGEYNSSHIPGACLIPRRRIEFIIEESVPAKGVHVVVCDDDGRRALLAAATLERLGYTSVSVLDGGVNRWSARDYPTEWGVNVPSKDFGEKLEVVHHVPEISAEDLHERIERGDKLVILDTRTPEEYQRFCIPGGRSMPGGELALRITDITKDLDEDTTVILNCAGRTRSITGTRVLQRMGIEALGLKNGTSGWLLAGFELENGGDLVELPEVSEEGRAAAEEYAAKLAAEDGVRYLSPDELDALMAKRDSQAVYLVDVRTDKEYTEGHIPGFRWWPGGQAVQRADDLAGVKNSTIVFCCDGRTRATVTGSLYRQMGHQEVYAVDGGAPAWAASGRELSEGMERSSVAGLGDAFRSVSLVSAQDLNDNPSEVVLFVDTSQDFSGGHTPGAKWLSRSWLELEIGDAAHDKSTAITVTCATGRNSALAAVTLGELGYLNVSVLEGGMAKWREAGLPVEQGLTGIVRPPADINYLGVDRSYGEMMNYLRWETELGVKYAS
jgi:rhodanese-related sulfurtransferase